jgi:hypothetical protein
VIRALIQNKMHIPYRESILTKLLMNSLSGSSRTTLLGCLSPNMENHEESLRTLQFVKRCKKLKTSPIQSLIKGKAGMQDQEMTNKVQSLEAENLMLKAELAR